MIYLVGRLVGKVGYSAKKKYSGLKEMTDLHRFF